MLDIEAERKLFEARALARNPNASTNMMSGRYVDRRLQLRWAGWLDCVNARTQLSEGVQQDMGLINKEVEDIELRAEEIRLLRQKRMSGHALPQVDLSYKDHCDVAAAQNNRNPIFEIVLIATIAVLIVGAIYG